MDNRTLWYFVIMTSFLSMAARVHSEDSEGDGDESNCDLELLYNTLYESGVFDNELSPEQLKIKATLEEDIENEQTIYNCDELDDIKANFYGQINTDDVDETFEDEEVANESVDNDTAKTPVDDAEDVPVEETADGYSEEESPDNVHEEYIEETHTDEIDEDNNNDPREPVSDDSEELAPARMSDDQFASNNGHEIAAEDRDDIPSGDIDESSVDETENENIDDVEKSASDGTTENVVDDDIDAADSDDVDQTTAGDSEQATNDDPGEDIHGNIDTISEEVGDDASEEMTDENIDETATEDAEDTSVGDDEDIPAILHAVETVGSNTDATVLSKMADPGNMNDDDQEINDIDGEEFESEEDESESGELDNDTSDNSSIDYDVDDKVGVLSEGHANEKINEHIDTKEESSSFAENPPETGNEDNTQNILTEEEQENTVKDDTEEILNEGHDTQGDTGEEYDRMETIDNDDDESQNTAEMLDESQDTQGGTEKEDDRKETIKTYQQLFDGNIVGQCDMMLRLYVTFLSYQCPSEATSDWDDETIQSDTFGSTILTQRSISSSSKTTAIPEHTRQDDKVNEKIQQLEMQILRLENIILSEKLSSSRSSAGASELTNMMLKLENELLRLNSTFSDLQRESDHVKLNQQTNANELALIKKDSGDYPVSANSIGEIIKSQHNKIETLGQIIQGHKSDFKDMEEKTKRLEDDNRVLVDRMLTQSMMMNEIMRKLENITNEQIKQDNVLQNMGTRMENAHYHHTEQELSKEINSEVKAGSEKNHDDNEGVDVTHISNEQDSREEVSKGLKSDMIDEITKHDYEVEDVWEGNNTNTEAVEKSVIVDNKMSEDTEAKNNINKEGKSATKVILTAESDNDNVKTNVVKKSDVDKDTKKKKRKKGKKKITKSKETKKKKKKSKKKKVPTATLR